MTGLDLAGLEHAARQRLESAVYDLFAGGAGQETTLASNERAWSAMQLWPAVLRDVSAVDTSTTLLGSSVAMPVVLAPVAYLRLVHPDGEAAVAAAAGSAGVLSVVSTRSSTPIERVAAAATGPWWMQVYVMRDRSRTNELVGRAAAAGCRALVLTVDTPFVGRKPRSERHGWAVPAELELTGSDDGAQQDPSITFDIIGELAERWSLPVVAKGVLRADDARRCVAAGAAAIVVSNHGGRQLDGAVASAHALPRVVDAVGDEAEVYVDGGIRHGVDVVRALASGACAAWIGRPAVWGLAVDGEAGVAGVLDGFRQEVRAAMALCGTPTVANVSPALLSG